MVRNPVRAVEKPSARRERAIVCLAPRQIEALRSELLARGKLWAATLVSVIGYAGLRAPEELLALEWRHIGRQTILVEQHNEDGRIVVGQKVRSRPPRAVDLVAPLRQDLSEWRMASGRPAAGALVFPRADGDPWRRHDYGNFRRRLWHPAREAAGVESLPPL